MRAAFTLVELLVVVTILVLLLAMLIPAVDQAIYQAELTVCGANQHGIGVAVSGYAFEHKRSYPYRPGVHYNDWSWRETSIQHVAPFGDNDDRPILRPYLSINDNLNCPLNKWIDLDASNANTECAYQLWFGFQFRRNNNKDPVMFKVGDRLTWMDGGRVSRFNLLSSDMDNILGNNVLGTHPDKAQLLAPEWTFNSDLGVGVGVFTISRWHNPGSRSERGRVDRNFLYADLSVMRMIDITIEEARQEHRGLLRAPIQTTVGNAAVQFTTLPGE